MTGSILTEANRLVHGARQAAYGHPAEDFGRTAALLNILLAVRLSEPLDAADVALIMVAVKLSREVNQHKRDNLVDAAGYLEARRMVFEPDEEEPVEYVCTTRTEPDRWTPPCSSAGPGT